MPEQDNQYDIVGYYDPRFLGVVYTFDRQEDWAFWFDWAFGRTQASRDLAQIAEGTDASEGSVFRRLFLATVFEHECRHFHDNLLSPLGCHLFRSRICNVINGLQLFTRAVASKKKLAVPFMRWDAMSPAEREAFARREAGVSQTAFYSPDNAERELLRVIAKGYQALSAGLQPHDGISESMGLSSLHIFEASALCAQMQAVWSSIGAAAADKFTSSIVTDPALADYARPIRALVRLSAERGVPLSPSLFESVLCWCLTGNLQRDAAMGSPDVRFCRLLAAFVSGGLALPQEGPLGREWLQWDKHFDVTPYHITIQDCQESDSRMIAETVRVGTNLLNGAAVMDVAQGYARLSGRFRSQFLQDPEAYARVGPYLQSKSFPVPRIRLEFCGGWVPVLEKGLAGKLFHLRRWKSLPNDQIGLEEAWVRQEHPEAITDAEIDIETIGLADESFRLCDYCFMESSRFDITLQQGAAIMSDVGVEAFEVF